MFQFMKEHFSQSDTHLIQTGMWAGEEKGKGLWLASDCQHKPQICKVYIEKSAHTQNISLCILFACVHVI